MNNLVQKESGYHCVWLMVGCHKVINQDWDFWSDFGDKNFVLFQADFTNCMDEVKHLKLGKGLHVLAELLDDLAGKLIYIRQFLWMTTLGKLMIFSASVSIVSLAFKLELRNNFGNSSGSSSAIFGGGFSFSERTFLHGFFC